MSGINLSSGSFFLISLLHPSIQRVFPTSVLILLFAVQDMWHFKLSLSSPGLERERATEFYKVC